MEKGILLLPWMAGGMLLSACGGDAAQDSPEQVSVPTEQATPENPETPSPPDTGAQHEASDDAEQDNNGTIPDTENTASEDTLNNATPARPNIIFIMSDDHAMKAISAYDDSVVATPNIDRIAQEGIRFDNAYVTNALCSPSRAVTLTGKMSHLNGVKGNADTFDGSQQTFPKLLQRLGYETAIYGKWHLKSQPTGFDHWEVLPGQGEYYQPDFETGNGTIKEEGYVTDIITDKVLNFLENKRDSNKPFMVMYQHKAPHRQWWPDVKDLPSLQDKIFEEPDTLFYEQTGRGSAAKNAEMTIESHMALSMDNKIAPENLPAGYKEHLPWMRREYRDNYVALTPEQKEKWDQAYKPINDAFILDNPQGDDLVSWKFQRYLQDYAAVIKSLDRNVGRVLDYLDEHGISDNTIVVYTSDQGFYLGEYGWFDKRFMYDTSFRTPLLMRWPAKYGAGTIEKRFVQNLDYAPTILDAAGIEEIPGDIQGTSLLPLLDDTAQEWRDSVIYHYYDYPAIHMVPKHYGIRTEKYKLIHFYGEDIDEWEFYDLEKDPNEVRNSIYNEKYISVIDILKEKILEKVNKLNGSI